MRTSVFQILGDALGLAVRRPVVLVPLLVPAALFELGPRALMLLGTVLSPSSGGGATGMEEGLRAVSVLLALGVVLWIGVFVTELWAVPTTIALIDRAEGGEGAAFGPAARQGLRLLLPFLGLTIVLGLIFLVALGLPGLLLSFVGLGAGLIGLLSSFLGLGAGASLSPSPPADLSGLSEVSGQAAAGLGAAALIGLIILGIWGLFLWVKLSLAVPALVLGKTGPLSAIGEGWRRSRGMFGRLLGLLLLVLVLGSVLGFLLWLIPLVGAALGQLLVFYLGTAALALAYRRWSPAVM